MNFVDKMPKATLFMRATKQKQFIIILIHYKLMKKLFTFITLVFLFTSVCVGQTVNIEGLYYQLLGGRASVVAPPDTVYTGHISIQGKKE